MELSQRMSTIGRVMQTDRRSAGQNQRSWTMRAFKKRDTTIIRR